MRQPSGPEPRAARGAARAVLRTLTGYLARHPRRVAAALALLVIAKLATILVPYVLKLIVDRLGEPAALAAAPVTLLVGYALLRFAATLFGELRDLVFAPIAQHVTADMHERTFAHLLSLSPRYHARRSTGALTRAVERGIAGMALMLGVALFTVLPTLFEITAVMALLFVGYGIAFTLVLAATFSGYTVFTIVFTARRAVHQRALNAIDQSAHGRLVDSLLNYETVKTHAMEGRETRRYHGMLDGWVEAAARNQRALSVLHVGQSAIIAGGVAAVMLLAGNAVASGAMTVGDLVLVNAYVVQVCLPLNALGFVARQARDAVVDAEILLRIFEEQPEIRDPIGRPVLKSGPGRVELEEVWFRYEPGRPVLRGVSLRIAPGGTLAVVGGSGSGKSTIGRLLLRLYEPEAGAIRIDGQDIRQVSQASLRTVVGVVPQDTALFNDTIAFNIAYGIAVNGDDGRVQEAARAAARGAQLHEFIESLPDGYDTIVGERGVMLSGGERQRIAIARLIARNPRIVIFDEATSALDAVSERAIQAELDRLAASRTTLVIAHRLSAVVGADEIVVLERGAIVERGTHPELLRLGGVYARMWELQQQQDRLRGAEIRAAHRNTGASLH